MRHTTQWPSTGRKRHDPVASGRPIFRKAPFCCRPAALVGREPVRSSRNRHAGPGWVGRRRGGGGIHGGVGHERDRANVTDQWPVTGGLNIQTRETRVCVRVNVCPDELAEKVRCAQMALGPTVRSPDSVSWNSSGQRNVCMFLQ